MVLFIYIMKLLSQVQITSIFSYRHSKKKERKRKKFSLWWELLGFIFLTTLLRITEQWCSCCSVTQWCTNLCNPMDCSTPGCPVLHHFLEVPHTHVHWVRYAIQPSHPLLSPFPLAFCLSQHQGLFQRVDSLHQAIEVLEFKLQHQSFQWIFKTDFLYDCPVGSPCSPRDFQESSPTPQFKASILNTQLFL